jgi:hypothetical protein
MITPECGIVPLAAAAHSQPFQFNFGDVPTWALAVLALATLIAAARAYGKQDDAYDKLAEQVDLQRQALADQQATSGKLADQVDLQRQALADQQAANAKQAEVLEAQLRELNQRADAAARVQADAVTITAGGWDSRVPGARPGDGPEVHRAIVTNGSRLPIRNVVCRMQTTQNDVMHPACLVARFTSECWVDEAEDTKVRVIESHHDWAFVFTFDAATHQALYTLRFTDDAGLHWQIDPDRSRTRLPDRADW